MPATTMIIIQPGADMATFETRSVELPEGEAWDTVKDNPFGRPSKLYTALIQIVLPILREAREDAAIERMRVLYEGEYRDMFVDDEGRNLDLPRNELATKIYRNNWLTSHPEMDPGSMPVIHGVAILFTDRPVWT